MFFMSYFYRAHDYMQQEYEDATKVLKYYEDILGPSNMYYPFGSTKALVVGMDI